MCEIHLYACKVCHYIMDSPCAYHHWVIEIFANTSSCNITFMSRPRIAKAKLELS